MTLLIWAQIATIIVNVVTLVLIGVRISRYFAKQEEQQRKMGETIEDHESRLRALERTHEKMVADVSWIREFLHNWFVGRTRR